jgi:heme exporter protein D
MSVNYGWPLITIGAISMVAGLLLVRVSARLRRAARRPVARRATRRMRTCRPTIGQAGALWCTSVTCGVITGMQWAVLTQSEPGAGWAVVLGMPAFLAGATVTRLLRLLRIAHGQRREARIRAATPGRGEHR